MGFFYAIVISKLKTTKTKSFKKFNKVVAVIGHLVWDRIINLSGEVVGAPGGIAYNLAALGRIADSALIIMPVCNIGYDLYDTVISFYSRFHCIDFSLANRISRKNKIHELVYLEDGRREEINIGELPVINPTLFNRCNKIDAALINYIGGDEFPPRYIKWLKQKYSPLIYLDYHSLSLGRYKLTEKKQKVKRYLRYHPHWQEYTSQADIIQMNHYELKSIFPETEDDSESIIVSSKKIFATGPMAVIITREEKGVIVISGAKTRLRVDLFPAVSIKKVVDPTGCGDSFAAGFVFEYLENKDIRKACRRGLKLAGLKAGFSGLNGFFR